MEGRFSPGDLAGARGSPAAAADGLRDAKLVGWMLDLAAADWANPHARRLGNRQLEYGDAPLTLLEFPGVPADSNQAKREIRPAVRMRKSSYGNQSGRGAATRAVLMTIYRTLKRRGLDPLPVIAAAWRTYTANGQLPPLPATASLPG